MHSTISRSYQTLPHKLLVLSVWLAVASRAAVKITPTAPLVVPVGTTVQFKANVPVTWSLAPGSVGSMDSDGTYHAPVSISVHNRMAGCQILPNDHVLNTRIDSLPVHPNSKAWMSQIPPDPLSYAPSWGTNIANAQTPKQSMHFFYTPQHDAAFEFVPWPYLKQESGVFVDPRSDADRHILTVDRDACTIFEIYNRYDPGNNAQCPTCTAQSGVRYSTLSYGLPQGTTDAAGLPLAPLSLHLEEILSGAVRHALRVTLQNSRINPSHIWPATANAGPWGAIPYGTRFRLRRDFDVSRYSPVAKILLAQLKEYGLFLADGGGNWEVDVSTDVTEDRAVMSAFGELSGARIASNLEVVDESSLMSSGLSGEVRPNNGYVKPDSYAEVIATDLRNASSSARARIALEGVTIGFPDPAIWIQSGVSKKLVAWVNGTSNKGLTWSMSPSLGTLTQDGVYTAPSVEQPTSITAIARSAADPESSAALEITVMPAGVIRIDVGDASRAPGIPNHHAPDYGPDAEGHMWWREQAGEVSGGVVNDDWYAQSWPKIQDVGLYYTSRYSVGDMTYRFIVPNGQYKIGLLLAQPGCKGPYPKNYRAPIHVEAQGQIVFHNFDMGLAINHTCDTPVVEFIPGLVTDNTLYFSLRRVTLPGDSRPSPLMNAFYIEPDASPPHLSIDPPNVSAATTAQHIQFEAVSWWTNNVVKWSLTGPGSISPTGLYTAPSVPPASDESVTIEARSAGNPALSARVNFRFTSGDLVLSPEAVTLGRSLSQPFKATMGGAPYANINWSITPPVGQISAAGLYTAPDGLSEDTRITVKAQSKDVPTKSSIATITVKAIPDAIRINCGGPGFKDAHGNTWSADYGFSDNSIGFSDPKAPITGTSADMLPLYHTSRYAYADQTFNYHFALPDGTYRITLKFADYVFDTPGHHIFDVKINGKQVLTKFDPNAVSTPRAAVDKQFVTSVRNKSLQIEFIGRIGGAIINGIEIVYAGPPGSDK